MVRVLTRDKPMRCEIHMCQNFTLNRISHLRLKLRLWCADLAHVSSFNTNLQVLCFHEFNRLGTEFAIVCPNRK